MKILLSLCVVGFFVLVGVVAKYYDRKIANEGHGVVTREEPSVKVVTREEFVKAVEIRREEERVRREEERSNTLARSQAQINTVKGAIQNGLYSTMVQYDPGISYIIEELQRLYPFLAFNYVSHGDHTSIKWEEKQWCSYYC